MLKAGGPGTSSEVSKVLLVQRGRESGTDGEERYEPEKTLELVQNLAKSFSYKEVEK